MNIQTIKTLIVILLLIFIGVFVGTTDLHKLALGLQKVGYRFMLLILITFVAYFFGALSWKYCIRNQHRSLPVFHLFIVRHIGETVSMLTPAGIVGGEAVKIFLMQEKVMANKEILASILLSRAIMVISQLTIFAVVLGIVLLSGMNFTSPLSHNHPYIFPLINSILVILILFTGNRFIREYIQKTGPGMFLKKKFTSLLVHSNEVKEELRLSFTKNKKALILSFMFCSMHWIAGGLEFYFILTFLGIPVGIGQAIFIDMGVMFFKAAGSFIPGQLGVEEYGNKVMLASVGIHDEGIWITASVLRRARQLFWIAFGGYLYFFLYKNHNRLLRYRDGNTFYKS